MDLALIVIPDSPTPPWEGSPPSGILGGLVCDRADEVIGSGAYAVAAVEVQVKGLLNPT
jgi:hypothetical protein